MDIRELFDDERLENIVYLPEKFNEAIIGIDAIDDIFGYDIDKLVEIDKNWEDEYIRLKGENCGKPMPHIINRKTDPTGLKCYSDMDNKIIGVTEDSRLVYMYDGVVEHFVEHDNMTEDEAMEWVEYNTLRATPYEGPTAPIILYDINYY